MSPDPNPHQAKVRQLVSAFRTFAQQHSFTTCWKVEYCGMDRPWVLALEPHEVLEEVKFCAEEGLQVAWFHEEDQLWLVVQEVDCPMPTQAQVKAHEAMVDVDALLRDAGIS